jgi:alpha-glucosidase
VMLDSENNNVLSWMRKVAGAPTVVIAANFTAERQTVNLVIPGASGKAKTLLKTPGATDPASFTKIELGPFGVYIGEAK